LHGTQVPRLIARKQSVRQDTGWLQDWKRGLSQDIAKGSHGYVQWKGSRYLNGESPPLDS